MQIAENITVAELAASSPATVRVFERLGIDYCCGGKRPLADVCRDKGLDPTAVQVELEAAVAGVQASATDWKTAPLAQLADHIVETHHEYLRQELPLLSARLEKVYRVYNQRMGPTLTGLPETFNQLRAEMEMHMRKEEMVLFPVIKAYEQAATAGLPLPSVPFGTVENPIRMMEAEHDNAGEDLSKMREITNNFEIPDYACVTYRALMTGLAELEQDLHQHIHLENNILFPRAAQIEASRRG